MRSASLHCPHDEALAGSGWSVSYGELDAKVSVVEDRLGGLGIAAGDRVALYMTKDVGYVVLLIALMRAGVVACPVSTRLPGGGVGPLLGEAGCAILVSSDGEIRTTLDGFEVLRPEDLLPDGGEGEAGDPASLEISLERPATVVFTSGSTGRPKAALHTFGNHYFNALGSNENIALSAGDRWLHSLPLYHVGGLSVLFRCLLAAATVVLPEPGATPGAAIPELGATHVSLVSTQLIRLLAGEDDLSGLKAVLLGGGPIPPSLVDRALSRGLPIHTSYGLTEMASQVTTTPPGAGREELRTAGRVLPHREVGVSEDGEVMVRGETLFAGYVVDGELRPSLDKDGWFRTGDLGQIDAAGRLKISGRKDNLFVSGGENVQPEEIEAALCRIGGVEEAVVVPVPDEEFGHRPVAFVRRSDGTRDLARELERVMPRFKVPKTFHDWEGSGGMKPDRTALGRRALRDG